MAEFDRFEALARFDHIEPSVQTHLKNVYSCLFMALLSAAAGAYVNMAMGLFMQAGFLTAIGTMGLMAWLYSVPHESKNLTKRVSILCGIGFLTGVSLAPLLEIAAFVDPSIIPTAFLASCLIFGCFSLTALYSRDRTWLYLGGTLMSILGWMLVASLLNIFFRSQLIYQAQIYIGLLLFCGFVLYDTQLIIEKRRRGDEDYVWHSVDLFLDFIQIFRKLLIILTQKEDDKKKRRN